MRTIIKRVALLGAVTLASVGYPSLSTAQPAVQSVTWQTDVQPTRLVINGSGFGTRSDYGGANDFLNRAWRNFQGESSFVNGTVIGNWLTTNTGGHLSLVADARYPGSRVAHIQYPGAGFADASTQRFEVGVPAQAPADWYCAFWFRMKLPGQSGKIVRHGSNGPNFYFGGGGNRIYPGFDPSLRGESLSCTGCDPAPKPEFGNNPDHFVDEQWVFWETILRKDPDELTVLFDGKQQYSFKSTVNQQWVHPGFNGFATVLHELDKIDRGYPTVGWWEAHDLYLDYSWARVIISDQPTYNPGIRHHREIQIPRQWSGSQIVVDFNQGSFVTGQQVYLYVVDANGRVSPGFQITAGKVGPAAPSNVRIIR